MSNIAARLLLLLFTASALSATAQDTPPSKTFPDGCSLDQYELPSPSMGRNIPVAVLKPPGLPSGQKLPVLYALHGRDAAALSFSEMKPLREFLVTHPMLVVAFQADRDSCYIDSKVRPHSFFTRFMFEELMPDIARRYPTNGQSAATGFSMGGFGAFHFLLAQPARFSSVSGMSSAFELFDSSSRNDKAQFWQPWLAQLADPQDFSQFNLITRVQKAGAEKTKLPPLLILCGTEDFLLNSNRRFIDTLREVNALAASKDAKPPAPPFINFEYREAPGAHAWPYWRDHIEQIAAFHWKHFSAENSPAPQ